MLFLSQASMANCATKVATMRTPTAHHMHRMTSCRGSVTLGVSNDAASPAPTGISPSPHEIRQPSMPNDPRDRYREPGLLPQCTWSHRIDNEEFYRLRDGVVVDAEITQRLRDRLPQATEPQG